MNVLLVLRRWSRWGDTISARITLNGREVGKLEVRSREWDAIERGNVEVVVADAVKAQPRRRSA